MVQGRGHKSLLSGDPLMVVDDLGHDEPEKLFRERRVEARLSGQGAQSSDLGLFATRIGGGQTGCSFVFTHGLSDLEAFSQHMDQRSVNIVDAGSIF
jgi:hypothetical protein